MTPDEIRAAIGVSPQLLEKAYADPADTQGIADALSVGLKRVKSPTMVSARGIAGKYPGGAMLSEVVMLKLEAARDSLLQSADPQMKVFGSLLRRQLGFLAGEGLDFGDPELRSQIDQVHAAGVITADEATNLKSLGEVSYSISEYEVRCAIFADDGTLKV